MIRRHVINWHSVPVRRVRLTLSCGHVVEIYRHQTRAPASAMCPECKTEGPERLGDLLGRPRPVPRGRINPDGLSRFVRTF